MPDYLEDISLKLSLLLEKLPTPVDVGAPAVDAVAAKREPAFTLIGIPTEGDTLIANGVVFTFKNAAEDEFDIQIGIHFSDTANHIADALNNSTDAAVEVATYTSNDADSVSIEHDTPGVAGNDFTFGAQASQLNVILVVAGESLSDAGAEGGASAMLEGGADEIPHVPVLAIPVVIRNEPDPSVKV